MTSKRLKDSCICSCAPGKAATRSTVLCWAARFKNSGSVLVSMDSLTQAISFSDFYADYQVPPGLNLLVTDLTTGEILSASDPAYTGKDAMRVGLTEEVLKAGFAGHFGRNAAPLPGS